MLDVLGMLFNLFSEFITFSDSFYIIGSLTPLRIVIILCLFRIALLFLSKKNNKEKE